jgi:hypothetical protein
MKVKIKKTKVNSIVNEEFTKLVVESYRKKDFKSVKELYKYETGKSQIDEGIGDWLKSKFKKVSNVFAGIKDIGLGSGTTILGGEETLDIEKRKEKLGAAKAKVEGWLSKLPSQNPLANEIKELYATLDKGGFPNPKNRSDFDSQVSQLQTVYKKIVDAYEGSAKTDADAKATNILIAVLRGIVIYFQDYKIADKYIYLKEAEEAGAGEEEELGSKEGEGSKSAEAAYSKKLPLGLAAAGVSMLALGIGANSPAFKNVLEKFKDVKKADPEYIKTAIFKELNVEKGQGITQFAEKFSGKGDSFLDANAPAKNLLDGGIQEAFDSALKVGAFRDKAAATKIIKAISGAAMTNKYKTVSQVIAAAAKGTEFRNASAMNAANPSEAWKALGWDPGKYQLKIGETVTEIAGGNIDADTLKNQFLNFLGKSAGAILTNLGYGFLGGAAVSAGMRFKGSKSSRMNDLRQLVTTFLDVKPGGGKETKPAGQEPTSPDGEQGKGPAIPGVDKIPGGPQTVRGQEEQPTIVDPSMQPTVVDPSMQATVVDPSKQGGPQATVPVDDKDIEDLTPKKPSKQAGPQATVPVDDRDVEDITPKTKPASEPTVKVTSGGRTLIKPDEFMKGALGGEPGEGSVEREVTNFYKTKLPDVPEKEIKSVLGWLVRNDRLLSEFKRRIAKIIKEDALGMGTGERGKFGSQVGTDPLGKKGAEAKKADPTVSIAKSLADKISKETGVSLVNVLKVLDMTLKNQKLAAHSADGGKTYSPEELEAAKKQTGASQVVGSTVPSIEAPPEEWDAFLRTPEGSKWSKEHKAAGGKIGSDSKPIPGTGIVPEKTTGAFKEGFEFKNRFMKLAGILRE